MTRKLKFDQLADYGFGPKVMEKTKFCPHCSYLVENGESACPQCGEKLPDLTLFAWYEQQHKCCPHCGTVMAENCRYCPQCGKPGE